MVAHPKTRVIARQDSALFEIEKEEKRDSLKGRQDPRIAVSPTFFSREGSSGGEPGPRERQVTQDWDAAALRADAEAHVPSVSEPLHSSTQWEEFTASREFDEEFLLGWQAMAPIDRKLGKARIPKPQTWVIVDVLNASHGDTDIPVYPTVGVCVPRRAAKTTSIFGVAMGRCLNRPGYIVIFTAQSGTKAAARFLDLARDLDRVNASDESRGFRILRGAGSQRIEFDNGSLFLVVPPKGDAFRGDAGDMIILDESQEHDQETSDDLLGAILPTMDTRPSAQLVIAGTAGEHRSGLLWNTLEEGRNQEPGTGIVEYAAPDDTPMWIPGEPVHGTIADPAVWDMAHVGIGTLTTMETMEIRFAKLPRPQFLREYLGMWPEDYTQSAIGAALWRGAEVDFVDKPADFAAAFDVAPDGSESAFVAAWRDDDGVAYIEVLGHEPGTTWLGPMVQAHQKRYPRMRVGYDSIGAALVEADEMGKLRDPKPKIEALRMSDIAAACAAFMRDLGNARLHHFGQPGLDSAVAGAAKRQMLGEKAWAWGRAASGGSITTLIAGTNALRVYDKLGRRERVGLITTKAG
jgi:hypothetical protein